MHIRIDPRSPLVSLRVVLIAALTLLLCGWNTCTVMGALNSCQDPISQPQLTSLSPSAVSSEEESMLLQVDGSNFMAQSQIMWNGNGLPTTFLDSRHLQTTITPQTFAMFGGTAGSTVQISVMSPASVIVVGCPSGSSSATLLLAIN